MSRSGAFPLASSPAIICALRKLRTAHLAKQQGLQNNRKYKQKKTHPFAPTKKSAFSLLSAVSFQFRALHHTYVGGGRPLSKRCWDAAGQVCSADFFASIFDLFLYFSGSESPTPPARTPTEFEASFRLPHTRPGESPPPLPQSSAAISLEQATARVCRNTDRLRNGRREPKAPTLSGERRSVALQETQNIRGNDSPGPHQHTPLPPPHIPPCSP